METPTKQCIECEKTVTKKVSESRAYWETKKYCSQLCANKAIARMDIERPTAFAKGNKPWNKDRKGIILDPNWQEHLALGRTGEFNKGRTPWNKGKVLVEVPKIGRRPAQYRRAVFGQGQEVKCNRCEKPAKLVHHKDGNPLNDTPENQEALCYSCHGFHHKPNAKVR